MAVRLVRAKRKIKAARIPYRVSGDNELPEWNAASTTSSQAPRSPAGSQGTEWVVQMRASGGRGLAAPARGWSSGRPPL